MVRSQVRLLPEPKRVISKPFLPGGSLDGRTRVECILSRVLELSEEMVAETLADVYERFASRHLDFTAVLERQFQDVASYFPDPQALSRERRRLPADGQVQRVPLVHELREGRRNAHDDDPRRGPVSRERRNRAREGGGFQAVR